MPCRIASKNITINAITEKETSKTPRRCCFGASTIRALSSLCQLDPAERFAAAATLGCTPRCSRSHARSQNMKLATSEARIVLRGLIHCCPARHLSQDQRLISRPQPPGALTSAFRYLRHSTHGPFTAAAGINHSEATETALANGQLEMCVVRA